MKFVFQNEDYRNDVDILVRAYENQSTSPKDSELFLGEVLMSDNMPDEYKNVRFSAPFPRGIVEGVEKTLKSIDGRFTVQVSNEIPAIVGRLTSCNEHFDIRMRQAVNRINGIKQ